jgi:hypothetical protein
MPVKPNTRNWKDVQAVMASIAVVSTLGLWELFAAPVNVESVEAPEPLLPPAEPPRAAAELPRMSLPPVKIMFTPAVSPTTTVAQQPQVIQKKKKNHNSAGSPTRTHTS